jgi:uncharacterized protein (UPF0335 family)
MEFAQDMLTIAAFCCGLYTVIITVFGMTQIISRPIAEQEEQINHFIEEVHDLFEEVIPIRPTAKEVITAIASTPLTRKELMEAVRLHNLQAMIKTRYGRPYQTCTNQQLDEALELICE